jgi:DNA-binding response OmpR family regulator
MASSGGWSSPDGAESVLREARQRFIASFPKRCDSIALLIKAIAANGPKGSAESLREIAHQVAGMAGTVGFLNVSERASELELLAAQSEKGFNVQVARGELDALRETFSREITTPPAWAVPAPPAAFAVVRILVVDDAEDQRQLMSDYLRLAGYEPVQLASGDVVIDAARQYRPCAILLDANLPGLDGYSVCRLIKSDPELSGIPVIFATVRSSLDDKLAGLTLGADEYLVKPVDMRELLLRLDLLLRRARSAPTVMVPEQRGQLLNFDLFIGASRELLKQSSATFALVRAPEAVADDVLTSIRATVRQKDIMSRYDPTHLVLLLGGAPPGLVRHRLADLIVRMRDHGVRGVWAGISFSNDPDEKIIETLLAEADDALAEARHNNEPAAVKSDRPRAGPPASTSIVLVEQDLEVSRSIETQMTASGYRTTVIANAEEAMIVIAETTPDIVLLDLVLPPESGFDLLDRVAALVPRPHIVVLSARGREDEITRAFEMGADDFVTKPFSPTELLARVARLLR